MTGKNWLTPETAIGCKLPCGATVVEAEWSNRAAKDCVLVDFDREPEPAKQYQYETVYNPDGSHWAGALPDLIPPSQPAEPAYTDEQLLHAAREAAARAYDALVRRGDARVIRDGAYDPAPAVQAALIMAREGVAALLPKPQPEPWREAYDDWWSKNDASDPEVVWRAAYEAGKREGGE